MVRSAALIGIAVLAGCKQGDPNICNSSFPARYAYMPAISTEEIEENAYRCAMHWGARLSLGSDAADLVAQAAVANCDEQLRPEGSPERQNQTNRLYRAALFAATQRRAGDCAIPDLGELPPPNTPRTKPPQKK